MKMIRSVFFISSGLFLSFAGYASQHHHIYVNVTASTEIKNLPITLPIVTFALVNPVGFGSAPSFEISSIPKTECMKVNKYENMPEIKLMSYHSGNNHIEAYYCDGLVFDYHQHKENQAVVKFFGQVIDGEKDPTVMCQCTGDICSTNAPIIATRLM